MIIQAMLLPSGQKRYGGRAGCMPVYPDFGRLTVEN